MVIIHFMATHGCCFRSPVKIDDVMAGRSLVYPAHNAHAYQSAPLSTVEEACFSPQRTDEASIPSEIGA